MELSQLVRLADRKVLIGDFLTNMHGIGNMGFAEQMVMHLSHHTPIFQIFQSTSTRQIKKRLS